MTSTPRPPAGRPTPPMQQVRVRIASTDPLTIELPGGATVPGIAVAGLTYAVAAPALALIQEPAVGLVFPIV